MHVLIEEVTFPLVQPFAITGHTFVDTPTLRVTLTHNEVSGRGESVGTYYLDETVESMISDLDKVVGDIDESTDNFALQAMLPACGARNALDCALWDYQAKRRNTTVWQMLGILPRPQTTVYTISIESVEHMAEAAARASRYPHLKIKLDGNQPVERLEAIREARPDAKLVIDVNQGWSFAALTDYLPHCQRLGISMIEQPLPRGEDDALEGFSSPVPLGADESCLHMGEFDQAARRYDVLNIKLDKCGGLTEGLRLVEAAQRAGMQLMVGNMMGSSLSMAPSFVIAQSCAFVDLDGPLLLAQDVDPGMHFGDGGRVEAPAAALWG